jgi:hypothetical protein
MLTQVLARIAEAASQPGRALLADALGVAALFLLLAIGLSVPRFA